jgi:hypothetical protein
MAGGLRRRADRSLVRRRQVNITGIRLDRVDVPVREDRPHGSKEFKGKEGHADGIKSQAWRRRGRVGVIVSSRD